MYTANLPSTSFTTARDLIILTPPTGFGLLVQWVSVNAATVATAVQATLGIYAADLTAFTATAGTVIAPPYDPVWPGTSGSFSYNATADTTKVPNGPLMQWGCNLPTFDPLPLNHRVVPGTRFVLRLDSTIGATNLIACVRFSLTPA